MSHNLGLLYAKEYFNNLSYFEGEEFKVTGGNIANNNKTLYDRPFSQDEIIEQPQANFTKSFLTTYPGLFTGSGYQHSINGNDEFKLGFFFDFTSGQPLIPGSSVKGTIRSAFPTRDKKYQAEKIKLIQHFFTEDLKLQQPEPEEVVALEKEIFDGQRKEGAEWKRMNIYDCDIFFDAVLSGSNHGKKFLGNDYITPHKHKDRSKSYLDPFVNPTPLQFLKILPGIAFEFRFNLKDSQVIKDLTAARKMMLFEKVLLFTGIGAKTNVGYGQFIEKLPEAAKTQNKAADEKKPDEVIPKEVALLLKKNKTFDGEIIIAGDKFLTIQFTVGSNIVQIGKVKKDKLAEAVQDQKVTITIQTDYKVTEPLNCSVKLK